MPPDPRYDDESISDEDLLLRFYAHEWYVSQVGEGEPPEALGAEALTARLSGFGFQSIRDARSGLWGMSVYVERLLPTNEGRDGLLRWWIETTGTPHSLTAVQAGSLRELGLGVCLDVVEEPFGEAHANVAVPTEDGERFTKSLRRRIKDCAEVVLP